jgi:Zn-finger nucleic acid-binding protein
MKCPSCTDAVLVMTDRQGVEIDYCAVCRGVWLDRGELDKLIERAASESRAARYTPRGPDFADSDYPDARQRYPGRRKSWLGDIFD